MVKRNIIANYLGTAWSALMGFLFVPLYIKYLGAEAYGVVSISVVLQSYLAFLDLGLTPMMGREIARFTAGAHGASAIRSLLRMIALIMWCTSAITVVSLWLAADWIASDWLQSESLPPSDIAHALRILAAVVGMRFVEGMYRGCLVGLQAQVTANVISSTAATLRGAGAVAVLAWWSPTLNAFFWWQGAVSAACLLALLFAVTRALPSASGSFREGIAMLRRTWRFAGGMLVTSLLVLLITQTDKTLLARLLTLSDYGRYALGLAIASTVLASAGPISNAVYPQLTRRYASREMPLMARDFHRAAQMTTVSCGVICAILVLFPNRIVALWTGDFSLANELALVVQLLAIANFLNAMVIPCYSCLLASGQTQFVNIYTLVSILVIAPALMAVVPVFGMKGAAAVWLGVNLGAFFIVAPASVARVLSLAEVRTWYQKDALNPVIAMASAGAICRMCAMPVLDPHPASTIISILITGAVVGATGLLASPELRAYAVGAYYSRRSRGGTADAAMSTEAGSHRSGGGNQSAPTDRKV